MTPAAEALTAERDRLYALVQQRGPTDSIFAAAEQAVRLHTRGLEEGRVVALAAEVCPGRRARNARQAREALRLHVSELARAVAIIAY